MKKLLSVMLASATALSLACGLVACGGTTTEKPVRPGQELAADLPKVTATEDPLASMENEDLTKVPACEITVWAPSASHAAYQGLVEKFKAADYKGGKYADVTVTFVAQPEGEVKKLLQNDLATAADVFFFQSGDINDLIKGKCLQPLSGPVGSYYSAAIAERDDESYFRPIVSGGYCQAFPTTADNGYFLYYDPAVFSDDDVGSLEKMVEIAKSKNKQIMWDYDNGFYAPSFWFGMGCSADFNASGVYESDFATSAAGKGAAQAFYKFLNPTDNKMANGQPCIIKAAANDAIGKGMTDGTVCAGIMGTWATEGGFMPASTKAAKLPTFKATVDGKEGTYQMGSFMGGKYCGVNPRKPNVAVAMALANFFTNEQGQKARFEGTAAGPTNKNVAASDAVKQDKLLAALLAQNAAGGYPQQNHPQAFWDEWTKFGNNVWTGTTTAETLETDLTTMANAIIAGANGS